MSAVPVALDTFIKESLNEKLHFLCSYLNLKFSVKYFRRKSKILLKIFLTILVLLRSNKKSFEQEAPLPAYF